jgi:hypothetical protein
VNSGEVPDVATLAKATAGLLRQGPEQSERLRQRLALVYGIDPSGSSWPRFVNNHAWALVRLQAQGAIRKLATGRYELVARHPAGRWPAAGHPGSGACRGLPGPHRPMADEGLVEAIRQLRRDGPFHGEGYRTLGAWLRFSGLRPRRRVLRLRREHGLLAQRAQRGRSLCAGAPALRQARQRAGRPHSAARSIRSRRDCPRQRAQGRPRRRSLRGARAGPAGRAGAPWWLRPGRRRPPAAPP